MNRVGLKDYLLNHADDNDLLDCAKAWDAANEHDRTHVPDIGVEIDSQNDDGFITGTVTVDGESCYFNGSVRPTLTFL